MYKTAIFIQIFVLHLECLKVVLALMMINATKKCFFIGVPLICNLNIARGLKFYHFLMVFTAKIECEMSAKSIVSFDFSHTFLLKKLPIVSDVKKSHTYKVHLQLVFLGNFLSNSLGDMISQ
jgi:hypothetical protein